MRRIDLEVSVGVFVLIGLFSLTYLSVRLGRMEVIGGQQYVVFAKFERAGGVKPGSVVEIAGVEVGKVKSVSLDNDYMARVGLAINKDVRIQDDSIASVKTKGLIGEKYVQISPGGSELHLSEGGEILDTESAVDLEGLISNYVFGKI
jgi:phospholipid/cholesterol/gamma-HCH transport system substrate-binding protein